MDPLTLLVSVSLLSVLCKAEVTPLFVQTGKDLLLEVTETVTLEGNDQLMWALNGKDFSRLDNTGKPSIFKSHSGRAEIFPQYQSVLIRNLTKSDSGNYRAHVSGDNPKDLAEYKVTVLDPVSPVNLTVKNCSSDSSNLTVTCSTNDSLISTTFTCVDQSCSEERGERAEFTTPAASLKVNLKKDSIICVHSNQVSRTEDVRKIEDFCEKDPVPPSNRSDNHPDKLVLWIVLPILALLAFISGVLFICQRKRKNKTVSMDNTVYEVPEVSNSNLPLEERPMNDTRSTELPTSIYHLLGHSDVPEESTERNRLPESIYATVQKVSKT